MRTAELLSQRPSPCVFIHLRQLRLGEGGNLALNRRLAVLEVTPELSRAEKLWSGPSPSSGPSASMTSGTPPRHCCSAPACRWSSFRRCFGAETRSSPTVYGHLATDYLRAEVNRLKLQGMPEAPRLRAVDAGRVPPVSPTFRKTRKGPERRGRNPSDSDPFSVSGRQDSNLRPLGPEGPSRISRESPDVQVLANSQAPGAAADAVAPVGRPRTLPHVTPVLPTSGRRSPRLSALDAPLLSVRETAERLRVSTATICAVRARRAPARPGVERHPAAGRGPRGLHPQRWPMNPSAAGFSVPVVEWPSPRTASRRRRS